MQTPQFPFKTRYQITQGYAENANNYPEGHHGAIDIVPFKVDGTVYPADIYPLFDGSEISRADTDVRRGKGVKERVVCDESLISYLKSKNVVPKSHRGSVNLDILYWHILDIEDQDKSFTQDTPIAHAGNTGWVFTAGRQVPDDQKGVPPYPGLHLHLECVLSTDGQVFNLDKDPHGRIDPQIILNYKGDPMNQTKVVLGKDGKTVYLCTPVSTMEVLSERASVEGITIPNPIPKAAVAL